MAARPEITTTRPLEQKMMLMFMGMMMMMMLMITDDLWPASRELSRESPSWPFARRSLNMSHKRRASNNELSDAGAQTHTHTQTWPSAR